MFTPNYTANFKTKEEAVSHILQMFVENPGVADDTGHVNINLGKQGFRIKPVKRRKNNEE